MAEGDRQADAESRGRDVRDSRLTAEQLVAEFPGHVVSAEDGFLTCNAHGVWTRYDAHNERGRRNLGALARRCDAEFTVTPGNIRTLAEEIHVLIASGYDGIQVVGREDIFSGPIIPFLDGSHVHLDGGADELCRDPNDIRGLYVVADWSIPSPDFDLLNAEPSVFRQFDIDYLADIARFFGDTSKNVDMIAVPQSNAGKTSWISALAMALPGLVVVSPRGSVKKARNERFTVAVQPLADSRLVIFDEAGKLDTDMENLIFDLTEDYLLIERKQRDAVIVKRLGNALFVGDSFAEGVDDARQGIPGRLGNLWEFNLQPITPAIRTRWLSHNEVARLRAWAVHLGIEGFPNRTMLRQQEADRAVSIEQMQPKNVAALQTTFKPGVYPVDGWVSSADLCEAIGNAGLPTPNNKQLPRIVLKAFPSAKSKTDSSHQKTRGWQLWET